MPAADRADLPEPRITFLHDGAQPSTSVLGQLIAFIAGATRSLDVAIYDAHLSPANADALVAAFDDAERRGVRLRALYNEFPEPRRPRASKASPLSGPSLLQRLTHGLPHRAIPGTPDLMHHKYVIRDRNAVWTGSANWTDDSWSRQENTIVEIPSADLAAAFQIDFDQLWSDGTVENTGELDDEPASLSYRAAPFAVRALFSPGRGREMSELIASHLRDARERIHVCSPVLTSAEILDAIGDRISAGDLPRATTIVIDGPQMFEAMSQWRVNAHAHWKIELAQRVLRWGVVVATPSTPYATGTTHDYMHAKLIVCDDVVITGSFNCSHSGEMNAENVLEIRSVPMADECAAFAAAVHRRYHQAGALSTVSRRASTRTPPRG